MVISNEVNYKCGLSKELQAIALEELREDENIRNQALEQFRTWILKHPSIKRCRTDSLFLLRFLRTKKFSLPIAQNMLEQYLTIKQLNPEFFGNLDICDPEMEAIIDSGYVVPLIERDEAGRQIVLVSTSRVDPYKFGSRQMIRAQTILGELLLDNEENQVRGYTYVYDFSGVTMAHVSAWSFTDVRNVIRWLQNSTPLRYKKIHLINVPNHARKIIDLALSFFSEKHKTRTMVHKNVDDFKEAIGSNVLPKELGGELPLADMIAIFKDGLRKKREEIKARDDMYIEISIEDKHSLSSDGLGGISGSFRKLEVD